MKKAPLVISSLWRTIIILLCSFFATASIYLYLFDFSVDNGKTIVWLIVFVGLFFIFQKAIAVNEKREKKVALVLAILFSLFTVIGNCIHQNLNLSPLFYSFPSMLKACFMLVGFFLIYDALLLCLFDLVAKSDFSATTPEWKFFRSDWRSFLVIWAVIFACWLPYFLVFFPGNLSSDSLHQIGQTLGTVAWTNHHPFAHTIFLGIFIHIGNAIGSLRVGVALYTITQMLIMSAIYSYAVYYLAKVGVNKVLRVCMLLFFALFPVIPLNSLIMWKDILFGGMTLWIFLLLFDAVRTPEQTFHSWKKMTVLTLSLFVFCIFRNNAIYALLILTPFVAFAFRKYWKSLLAVGMAFALLLLLYNFTIFSVLHVKKSPMRESLSVPLQQIARTVRDHEQTLSEEEKQTINEIMPVDEIGKRYDPLLSDPVKITLNEQAFSANKGKYMSLWLRLFLKHPKTYVESFLCNSYGYWYPDVPCWTAIYGKESGYDITIEGQSFWEGGPGLVAKINATILPAIPGISMLYSMGFSVWIFFISAGILILKRQKKYFLPIILIGGLWLTTLASPVFLEYRYLFGLAITAPVCLVLTLGIKPSREREPVPDAKAKQE